MQTSPAYTARGEVHLRSVLGLGSAHWDEWVLDTKSSKSPWRPSLLSLKDVRDRRVRTRAWLRPPSLASGVVAHYVRVASVRAC
eukprot:scaffold6249_cov395-Prasinococcus_capsulatus_cf.AAC.9